MLKELGASLLFEKGIEGMVKWYLFSKITPSLFTLKEGSTSHPDPLQWSLHPLRFPRFRGTETFLTVKEGVFESLRLPLAKGSSTSNQAFSIVFTTLSIPLAGDRNLRRKDVTALLGARNRYALRLADHQRSSPCCPGWDRREKESLQIIVNSLQFIVYRL